MLTFQSAELVENDYKSLTTKDGEVIEAFKKCVLEVKSSTLKTPRI